MKPDDTQLLAYVDGELPAAVRKVIEEAMRTDPNVAEQVELLRTAAELRFRDAFTSQQLPPAPQSLIQAIERLAREHAANSTAAGRIDESIAGGVNDPLMPAQPDIAPAAPIRSRLRVAPSWLAVALVAGAFICGAVLRFGSGSALNPPANMADTWIAAATGYQQLYTRATLQDVDADRTLTQRTLDEIHRDDGLDITIPDLRPAGLTFKRVQRLRFHGRALVQIAYLPELGAPVALCVVKDARPDSTIATRQLDNMNVVTWRNAQLSYVLIANPGDTDLPAIARSLSNRQIVPLFSEVEPNRNGPHSG